jgi:hypothetical protein
LGGPFVHGLSTFYDVSAFDHWHHSSSAASQSHTKKGREMKSIVTLLIAAAFSAVTSLAAAQGAAPAPAPAKAAPAPAAAPAAPAAAPAKADAPKKKAKAKRAKKAKAAN